MVYLFKHSDPLCALKVQTVEQIYTPDMINALHHNKYLLPIIKVANIQIQINGVTVSGQKDLSLKTEGKTNALRNLVNEVIF